MAISKDQPLRPYVQELGEFIDEIESDIQGYVVDEVDAWLDAHPEATTTVQDNSINGATKIIDGTIPDAKLAQTNGVLDTVAALESYVYETIPQSKTVSLTSGQTIGPNTKIPIEVPANSEFVVKVEYSQDTVSNNAIAAIYAYDNNNNMSSIKTGVRANTEYTITLDYAVTSLGLYLESQYIVANGTATIVVEYANPNTYSLGHRVADLEEDVPKFETSFTGIDKFSNYAKFESYGLAADGTFDTTKRYRASCIQPITFDRPVKVSVKDGFRWGYDTTNPVTWYGWYTYDVTIPANTEFIVQIARVMEDTSEVADVDEFVSAVTFDTELKEYVDEVNNNVDAVGFVAGVSAYEKMATHMRSFAGVAIPPSEHVFDINIASGETFVFRLEGTGIISSYLLYANGSIIRYSLLPDVNYEVTAASDITWLSIYVTPESALTTGNLNAYVVVLTSKDGNLDYVGEKITLATPSDKKRCQSNLWKDFLGAEIQNITDYSLHLNQSLAIYNGYVFAFSADGGGCTIIDYDTKSIISHSTFTPSTAQHANSAQFTSVFYDTDDEFPLMLLSRCGNSAGGSGNDECLVYRITRSSTTFTFTLINSIDIDFNTYGTSWGIDNNTNLLYMMTYLNGTWQTTEDNPLVMLIFNAPDAASLISGNAIELSIDDAIAKMSSSHEILQGIAVNGGIVYAGITQAGIGQSLWCFDVWRNIITSKVKLQSTKEVEGVAIYDNKIYLSQKSGTDTTGVNPMQIWELDFDCESFLA